MPDLLRIVRYDEQDQLVTIADLETATVHKLRDTFRFTPGGRTASTASSDSRRGGARQTGERRDNGSVGASWAIVAATTDAAIAALEALLAEADNAGRNRYVLFRPSAASRPTLYRIEGTATAAPAYRALPAAVGYLTVEASWPVAPLAEELRLDFADDWRARDPGLTPAQQFAADYTANITPASAAAAALELAGTAAGDTRRIARLDRRAWQDGWVTLTGKAKAGAASAALALTPGLRYDPATGGRYFAALNGGNLNVYEWDGATLTSRASTAQAAPAVDVNHSLRIRAAGAAIVAEYWTGTPTLAGTPTSTVTYATGTVRDGYPLASSYGGPAAILARLESLPFTYRGLDLPAALTVPALPGTAPASVAVDVAPGTPPAASLMLAWRRALPGRASSGVKSLVLPGEGYVETGGAGTWSLQTAPSAAYRGTTAARLAPTTLTEEAWADYRIDPTIFEADAFADDLVTVAVFARMERAAEAALKLPRYRIEARDAASDALLEIAPELGTAGRAPGAGTTLRSTFLGTLRLPVDAPSAVDLRLRVAWGAGSTATGYVWVDELVAAPVAALAMSAAGKSSTDGTYTLAVPAGVRRVREDLSGALAATTGPFREAAAGMAGARLELPAGAPGVELTVRPAAAAVDDANTGTSDSSYASSAVHLAVTPRHHAFA